MRSALADAEIACRFTLDKDSGFPVRACRELMEYQRWLKALRLTPLTPQALRQPLPAPENANRWQMLIRDLIEQWEAGQGDEPLPAEYFDFFLQEYLNAQRRQVRFGSGVLLSTVHGVKGEEFEHVILLGADWGKAFGKGDQSNEEERRLFYVGMTRAISRLVMMQLDNQQNPHLPLLEGGSVWHERSQAVRPVKLRRYAITGLGQLDIGFAGAHPVNHAIHSALSRLQPGMRVDLIASNRYINVIHKGTTIAQFSAKGKKAWDSLLPQIRHAEILALIQRNKSQQTEEYQGRCKVEEWLIPILLVEIEDTRQ